jgi:molecular chaperone GrpE
LESLLQGLELVQRNIGSVLAKHGVTEIEALGQPFDPSKHEALAQLPDESVPPNTVVQVLQRGYWLRDRLLRPAQVMVSKSGDAGLA